METSYDWSTDTGASSAPSSFTFTFLAFSEYFFFYTLTSILKAFIHSTHYWSVQGSGTDQEYIETDLKLLVF